MEDHLTPREDAAATKPSLLAKVNCRRTPVEFSIEDYRKDGLGYGVDVTLEEFLKEISPTVVNTIVSEDDVDIKTCHGCYQHKTGESSEENKLQLKGQVALGVFSAPKVEGIEAHYCKNKSRSSAWSVREYICFTVEIKNENLSEFERKLEMGGPNYVKDFRCIYSLYKSSYLWSKGSLFCKKKK